MKTKINTERRKAAPGASDLQTAKEVWKNGEVTPSKDTPAAAQSGPLGRVADAGDIGTGAPSVYGTEIAAEVAGTYSGSLGKAPKKRTSQ
jgi:hypothetical protein